MTTTLTAERREFLSDVLSAALAYADYWADTSTWIADDQHADASGAPLILKAIIVEHETGEEFTVELSDLARGIRRAIDDDVRWQCEGGQGMPRANRTNGGEGDYDAIDADIALQYAVFGEVVYG